MNPSPTPAALFGDDPRKTGKEDKNSTEKALGKRTPSVLYLVINCISDLFER
jgi:hypothetical protein